VIFWTYITRISVEAIMFFFGVYLAIRYCKNKKCELPVVFMFGTLLTTLGLKVGVMLTYLILLQYNQKNLANLIYSSSLFPMMVLLMTFTAYQVGRMAKLSLELRDKGTSFAYKSVDVVVGSIFILVTGFSSWYLANVFEYKDSLYDPTKIKNHARAREWM